jgi:hypothetical protein
MEPFQIFWLPTKTEPFHKFWLLTKMEPFQIKSPSKKPTPDGREATAKPEMR